MGNIGSQISHINQFSEEQWTYSFPRPQPHLHQHKVLPERDPRQKLRSTNNGEILHSGGTLSGRNQINRTTIPKEIKRCDSEPDLRLSSTEFKDAIRPKKKYKAPSPPKMQMARHKMQREEKTVKNNSNRKPRLFKTRLETKKINNNNNNSSPILKNSTNTNDVKVNKKVDNENIDMKETLPESNFNIKIKKISSSEQTLFPLNSQDFQDELKFATSNLKYGKMNSNNKLSGDDAVTNLHNNEKEKLKTLDHNISNMKRLKQKEIQPDLQLDLNEKKTEPKTFYFGMDKLVPVTYSMDDNFINDYEFNLNHQEISSSLESDLSSWVEMNDCQISKNSGIALKLRPILPKKPLEIPRFSPVAAWRLLSSVNSSDTNVNNVNTTKTTTDCSGLIEERIEKYSRPPPPAVQIARFSNDKSGDSGISGDAGPTGYDDNGDVILSNSNNILEMPAQFEHRPSWTPQQDLEDDSSMEEYLNSDLIAQKQPASFEFNTKPHVFSLSLPRDNHLASYMMDRSLNSYTGLKKLKRSVSGVLGSLSNKRDFTQPNLPQEKSDNWLLSKSAANSLTNGFNSLEMRYSQKSEDSKTLLVPSKHNAGRVMYLPELDVSENPRQSRSNSKNYSAKYRSRSMDRLTNGIKMSVYSKSMDNLNADIHTSSEPEPEDLQDPAFVKCEPSRKPQKKFTFQSTIRQIERKIIAEKLSREAERKEKQRLREVEAMRKVEEEFQKKRAREKAVIRQQLRMYTMDDVPWSSLQPYLDDKNKIPTRTEPDGAASSPETSSPSLAVKNNTNNNKVYQKNRRKTDLYDKNKPHSSNISKMKTQVLSEFKQTQRNYKDYRSPLRHLHEYDNNVQSKQTTVHPQVKCNMPRTRGKDSKGQSKANYRKDFANGIRSTDSLISDDSHANNLPYHSKNASTTRF